MTHEPPAADPWIDRVIDQRYRVLERVGQGGMGVVYRVEHVRMSKIAALKVLHTGLSTNEALTRRFQQEAKAISKLNHPNIVQVFDFGQVDGSPYLVMEFLSGVTLGDILTRDGPYPYARCVPLMVQVCDALTEAHTLGIIHRDLKPENIQISRTLSGHDLAKVLDFGLAKIVETGTDPADTAQENLLGTPYYMAPEQIRRKPLDPRCDVYSLGAVAYRTLTGKPPFNAQTPIGVLTKHITEPLTPPSASAPDLGIPAQIDAVVIKAMAKDRDQRYRTADEFKHAILDAANRAASSASPLVRNYSDPGAPDQRHSATTPPRLSQNDLAFEDTLRRARWLKVGLVLLIAALAGGAFYLFGVRRPSQRPASREREPNNTADTATAIDRTTPVSGRLGKRLSRNESDRDWYRLRVDGDTTQEFHAELGGVPNMDLTLELYGGQGDHLVRVDSTSTGDNETLQNWHLAPGTYLLLIREVSKSGSIPTENITDWYKLAVSWRPLANHWEREPNDHPRHANQISPNETVRGFVGAAADRDTYRLPGIQGLVQGTVSAIPGVDVVLEIWQVGDTRTRVLDAAGPSAAESFDQVALEPSRPAYLTVRRKDQTKVTGALPGIAQAYQLTVSRQPR